MCLHATMIPLPRLTMVVAKIKVTTKAGAHFQQEMEMDSAILKITTAHAVGTVVTAAELYHSSRLIFVLIVHVKTHHRVQK